MGIPDIVYFVAIELEIRDLASLSGVCTCYSGIARQEFRFRVYNILKVHVSPWETSLKCNLSYPIVDSIKAFLGMLRDHRSVVAGMLALEVLLSHTPRLRGCLGRSDMEILTPRNEAAGVISYLTLAEGYVVDTQDKRGSGGLSKPLDRPLLYWNHRTNVRTANALVRERDGKRVYVIESSTMSALSPASQSSNTLSCNWLDWNGISCAYPKDTFEGLGTHNPSYRTESLFMMQLNHSLPIMDRYMLYDFYHGTHRCTKRFTYCPRRQRISEDAMTFRMELWPHSDCERDCQLDHHRAVTYRPRAVWIWGDWHAVRSMERPDIASDPCVHGRPLVISDYRVMPGDID